MRGVVSLRGFVEVLGSREFALGIKLSLFERSEFDNFIPVFSKITTHLVPQKPRTSPHPAHRISVTHIPPPIQTFPFTIPFPSDILRTERIPYKNRKRNKNGKIYINENGGACEAGTV